MQLSIAVAPHHGRAHRQDAVRRRGTHLALQVGGVGIGILPVAAPAGQAGFQRPQGLLERFLEAAADGHGLTHRLHRGGQHRRTAPELLKGETRHLGDDVINGGFKTGGRGAGDVIDDFIERVTHRQARRDLGDREAGGLAGQGRRTGDAGIHLNHHHRPVLGVDGELDVAAARIHPNLANDGDRLVAQSLVFAVGEGLGRRHRDRVAGVDPHGIEILDAANDHHVVGGVPHHLQFKFLPAQQRLLHQDLGDGAGLEAALADGPELFRVVSNSSA